MWVIWLCTKNVTTGRIPLFYERDDAFRSHVRDLIGRAESKKTPSLDAELDKVSYMFSHPIMAQRKLTKEYSAIQSIECLNGFRLIIKLPADGLLLFAGVSIDSAGSSFSEAERRLDTLMTIITFLYGPSYDFHLGSLSLTNKKHSWNIISLLLNRWLELLDSEQCYLVEAVEEMSLNIRIGGGESAEETFDAILSDARKVVKHQMGCLYDHVIHTMLVVESKVVKSTSSEKDKVPSPYDILLMLLVSLSYFPSHLVPEDLFSRTYRREQPADTATEDSEEDYRPTNRQSDSDGHQTDRYFDKVIDEEEEETDDHPYITGPSDTQSIISGQSSLSATRGSPSAGDLSPVDFSLGGEELHINGEPELSKTSSRSVDTLLDYTHSNDVDSTANVTGNDSTADVNGDDSTAAVVGDDSTTGVNGDDSTAGVGSTADVTDDDSSANVIGNDSTTGVNGDDSTAAVAGNDSTTNVADDDSTADITGDDSTADVTGNDSTTDVADDDTTAANVSGSAFEHTRDVQTVDPRRDNSEVDTTTINVAVELTASVETTTVVLPRNDSIVDATTDILAEEPNAQHSNIDSTAEKVSSEHSRNNSLIKLEENGRKMQLPSTADCTFVVEGDLALTDDVFSENQAEPEPTEYLSSKSGVPSSTDVVSDIFTCETASPRRSNSSSPPGANCRAIPIKQPMRSSTFNNQTSTPSISFSFPRSGESSRRSARSSSMKAVASAVNTSRSLSPSTFNYGRANAKHKHQNQFQSSDDDRRHLVRSGREKTSQSVTSPLSDMEDESNNTAAAAAATSRGVSPIHIPRRPSVDSDTSFHTATLIRGPAQNCPLNTTSLRSSVVEKADKSHLSEDVFVHKRVFLRSGACDYVPTCLYVISVSRGINVIVAAEITDPQRPNRIIDALNILGQLLNSNQSNESKSVERGIAKMNDKLKEVIDLVNSRYKQGQYSEFCQKMMKDWKEAQTKLVSYYVSKDLKDGMDRADYLDEIEDNVLEVAKMLKRIFKALYMRLSPLAEDALSRIQRLQKKINRRLVLYKSFLLVKANLNMAISAFQNEKYPGLVHFIYIYRNLNIMKGPSIQQPVEDDSLKAQVIRDMKVRLWRILPWMYNQMTNGYTSISVKDGDFVFTFDLYIYDEVNYVSLPKVLNDSSLYHPNRSAVGNLKGQFYKRLLRRTNLGAGCKCVELLTVHFAVIPRDLIFRQRMQLFQNELHIPSDRIKN